MKRSSRLLIASLNVVALMLSAQVSAASDPNTLTEDRTTDLDSGLTCAPSGADTSKVTNDLGPARKAFTVQAQNDLNAARAANDQDKAAEARSCFQKVNQATNKVQDKLTTATTNINNNYCAPEAAYSKEGTMGTAWHAHDMVKRNTSASSTFASVPTELTADFGTQTKPATDTTPAKYSKCSTYCANTSDDAVMACNKIASGFNDKITASSQAIALSNTGANSTWTKIEVGMAAAAVVGTVLVVKAVQRHNDATKRAKIASDYNNGIIHNADGTTTNCLTASTYSTSTCQPVLINYCSNTANTAKPGCTAFNASYCASASANQSYCLTGTSTTYCSQAGTAVATSPACTWLSSRATTCTAASTDVSCLSTMSATQLTNLCPSYPNDPLCQAYTAGYVVTSGSTATTTPITSNTATTSLNTVVGTTTSASTATTTTTPLVTTSTGGVTIKAATPVANVWANNTSVLNSLCQSGQMTGCTK